jgi:tetratricopeptide (TPR) repeat protein
MILLASSLNLVAASESGTDPSEIVVGEETYRKPFTQYPPLVAEALKNRPVEDSHSSQGPDYMFFEADWLLLLGISHRRTLEEHATANVNDLDFKQISLAINALQQGVSLIQHIRVEYPAESPTATDRLGELFVNIGETYNISPHDYEYTLAMDFFIKAEEIYREKLQDEEPAWGEDSRNDVEIRWAHCCHRIGVALLGTAQDIANGANLEAALFDDDPEKANEIVASSIEKIHANARVAEEHLRKAVTVFTKALEEKYFGMDQEIGIQGHLATTLSNLGTAVALAGDLEGGIEYVEQALVLHRKLLERLPVGDITHDDATMDIADILYSLAEQYLQLGKYDKAIQNYSRAMVWNEEHNIAPPGELGALVQQEDLELDDAVEDLESQLEAYNVVNNDAREIPVSDYEDRAYENYPTKDDLYEGDIHVNLGSLLLAKGDFVAAGSHLSQAIKLYELSDEEEDRNVADAKYNMAVLYYRTGEFSLSREMYEAAVDIYRTVVGEGVDPRMVGMDPEQVPRVSPWQLGKAEQADEAEQKIKDSEIPHPGDKAKQKSKDSETTTQPRTKKQKEGTIHKDWLDLDDVKDTRMNATIKDEL